MAVSLFGSVRSGVGLRKAPARPVPTARPSYADHASYMQVWTIARARATIGAPSLESRTPCNAALFHAIDTFRKPGTAAVAERDEKFDVISTTSEMMCIFIESIIFVSLKSTITTTLDQNSGERTPSGGTHSANSIAAIWNVRPPCVATLAKAQS